MRTTEPPKKEGGGKRLGDREVAKQLSEKQAHEKRQSRSTKVSKPIESTSSKPKTEEGREVKLERLERRRQVER